MKMNRSLRLLTSILTGALVASVTGPSPANAVVQGPSISRSAAVVTPSTTAATTDAVAPLAPTAISDAIALPNVQAMVSASAYYGTSTYTTCTPSCDLYARAGTLALPGGATVPIWGYSTGTDTAHPVTLPGPTLTLN